jgi:acyl carrier protein
MTDQEKIDFLKKVFTEMFKKELPEISRDMPIQNLGLDSLDIVELQMEFEKEFDVEIPDPQGDLKTIGDLLDHLNV